MKKKIYLTNWFRSMDNRFVFLSYSNGDSFLVKMEDFNRAFGAIVSGDYYIIKKEFSI